MKSARILLPTFGSFGDIHPFLAIAHELQSRGHQPVIATSELYRAKIESDGIAFYPIRPDLPPLEEWSSTIPRLMDTRSGTRYLFREVLMPALRGAYEDLLPAAQNAAMIVTHSIVFAGPLVAEKLNKPWLSTALAPLSLWSAMDPPYPPGAPLSEKLYDLPPAFHRNIKHFARRFSARWTTEVGPFRAELGLPSAGHPLFEGAFSPQGVLALFSRELAAPQADWPQNTIQTGTCFYDKKGEFFGSSEFAGNLFPDIKKFLVSGEAPIVFTLGSAAVFDAQHFYDSSLFAAQRLGKRAIFLIGQETNRPACLPQNTDQFAAFEYAPYGELFSRACAVVHQGGAGTTAQVLRAGVPSLVMPYSHDQPDHAMRLQRLGVARVIAKPKYSLHRAAQALKTILDDSGYALRAKEIGLRVQKENGARSAADAIENALERA